MFLDLLMASPALALAWATALILSLTVHEFAHALVGKWRGDDTAENMGRLSLNPLAHLDPFGTLMLLFVGFGWAKPVPFDPRNLKNPLLDGVSIALAGPFANLMLAIVSAGILHGLAKTGNLNPDALLPAFLFFLIFVNMLLFFFNLLPLPPLDGSKVTDALLLSARAYKAQAWLQLNGPRILLGLVILSYISPVNIFVIVQWPAIFVTTAFTEITHIDFFSRIFGA